MEGHAYYFAMTPKVRHAKTLELTSSVAVIWVRLARACAGDDERRVGHVSADRLMAEAPQKPARERGFPWLRRASRLRPLVKVPSIPRRIFVNSAQATQLISCERAFLKGSCSQVQLLCAEGS